MKHLADVLNNNKKGSELLKRIFVHSIHTSKFTLPELSKSTNYSLPAVTKHVAEMVSYGYMIDCGKTDNKEGRPAVQYMINSNSCYFIGVMVHSQFISMGICNLQGDVIKFSINKSFKLVNDVGTVNEISLLIKQFINTICTENPDIKRSKIVNINVAISGRVNPTTGYSFSLFHTGEIPLNEVLQEKLKCNVTIDNDASVLTYGEFVEISKREKVSNMLCFSIGHGVGMGIIIDGKLYAGKSGFTGEVGHLSVYDNDNICHCGKKGCLESEASGTYAIRQITECIKDGSSSHLASKVQENKQINLQDIIDAIIKKEDPLCIEVIEQVGLRLGRQIANMINIFNPEKIVISGQLSIVGNYLLNPIMMSVNKHALRLVHKDTEIVISSLNIKAGVLGSCLLARNKMLAVRS